MNHKLLFQKTTKDFYVGRNGKGKCIGLELSDGMQDGVLIEPINSRNAVANCTISIPLFVIPELIAELKKHYEMVTGSKADEFEQHRENWKKELI